MANEAILSAGTTLTLAATGTTASIADGGFYECVDDTRTASDNPGYPLGEFVFTTAAGGFSAAPTAGAIINLYEQKIVDGTNDAPDVDANYRNDYIGSFVVDLADAQQRYAITAPIYRRGAKYWVEWLDGGTGSASVDAGWSLTLTPVTYGTA